MTLFENNYLNPFRPNIYEATFVYLIRQQGELTIHTDHHLLGLFSLATWESLFIEAGLTMQKTQLNGLYDHCGVSSYQRTITLDVLNGLP